MVRGGCMAVALAALAMLAGCASADDSRPQALEGSTVAAPVPTPTPLGCVDGEERDCVIPLPDQGGVHNCYAGRQVCQASVWGDCAALGASTSSVQTFAASCPAGTAARWTKLGYVLDLPSNGSGSTEVELRVQSEGAQGALVPLAPAKVAKLPDGVGEATCDVASGACGADLGGALGEGSSNGTLRVHVKLRRSPDDREAPRVLALQPSYVCEPR